MDFTLDMIIKYEHGWLDKATLDIAKKMICPKGFSVQLFSQDGNPIGPKNYTGSFPNFSHDFWRSIILPRQPFYILLIAYKYGSKYYEAKSGIYDVILQEFGSSAVMTEVKEYDPAPPEKKPELVPVLDSSNWQQDMEKARIAFDSACTSGDNKLIQETGKAYRFFLMHL